MKLIPTKLFEEHNYAIIDRVAIPTEKLRWDLPLLEIVAPVIKPQAELYPYLLPIHWIKPDIRQEIIDEVNHDIKHGQPPLFSMLVSSQYPPETLRVYLANCLIIHDKNRRENYHFRYYDPRVFFHLAWAYSADEERYFTIESGIDHWTMLLNDQWHTVMLSGNWEDGIAQEKAKLGRLTPDELEAIGLINNVLGHLPDDIKQKSFVEHIELSKLIYAALKCGREVYQLKEESDLCKFAYHSLTVDADIQRHPVMANLLTKCQRGGSYRRLTALLTETDWQKIVSDLDIIRQREQKQLLVESKGA